VPILFLNGACISSCPGPDPGTLDTRRTTSSLRAST
jgi:hypothetical protein